MVGETEEATPGRRHEWAELRRLIQQHFSLDELRTLCFDLAIKYDGLGEGLRLSVRVVRLLEQVIADGRLEELLSLLGQSRPHAPWPAPADLPPPYTGTRADPAGLIAAHFDLDGLRILCFDLGIRYDELGEGLPLFVRITRLLAYATAHERLDELHALLHRARPQVAWPAATQLARLSIGQLVGQGRLVNVPALPPHYLLRPADLAALKVKVLAAAAGPVGVTGRALPIGVQGMGGIGKSVLAAALAYDENVRAAFPDGIYWLELGQTPNLLLRQSQLAEALGDGPRAFEDTQQGKARLSQLLAGKSCLIILDDVWHMSQAQALDGVSGSGGSRLLITTRDSSLLTGLGAVEHRLDVLDESQALALLADWTGQVAGGLPVAACQVARRCDYLPLALALCGARVRDGLTWEDVLAALDEANLAFLDHPHGSVMASMHLSVAALPERDRELYPLLAAVLEDSVIPEAALVGLWGQVGQLNQQQSRHLLTQLAGESLLRLSGESGKRVASLHDLQHLYLRQQAGAMSALHEQWLAAYAAQCPVGWATGPDDGYFFQHLAYHLHAAGREGELRRLLVTFAWLQARLEATDVIGLVQDYDWLAATAGREDALWLVQGALRLSAHVLARDKSQLAGQLLGRLLALAEENEAIATLLAEVRRWQGAVWLCPLHGNLTPPDGPLVRTMVGHTEEVNALTVTPDGRLALTASEDRTVKVWEIATGRELPTFQGHTMVVRAVAVTPDGRLALFASWRAVKVWEIATGRELRTFQGHTDGVTAVAVTPDGRLALSASRDGTVKVWDIVTGREVSTFQGHKDEVKAVAVTPDGRLALSASQDKTVKVWDIATSWQLYTIKGHRGAITAVAVTPDGRLALSASEDRTVKVWEIATGRRVRTFKGHKSGVTTVAVTPDGRLALSASHDKMVKVWEMATGREVNTFQGHISSVSAVAVTPDDWLALSASRDGTVKVWDISPLLNTGIATGRERRTLEGHTDTVCAVAVTRDGRLALSASRDRTVKVWEIATGRELRTFQGHTDTVHAVAVTRNGRLALSASWDKTVKVWEIATGQELHTFQGHTDGVTAVAVTPDGRLALSASWKEVKVWEITTGRELRTFQSHTGWVHTVAVTPADRLALSASGDETTAKVWKIATGRELRTFQGYTRGVMAVVVTRDGRLALSASEDRTVKVWEIATGRELRAFQGHTDRVWAVAVTPDGRLALSASWDKTVKVWDLAAGQMVASFEADYPLYSLALSGDGITVVAGGSSGQVHFFRLVLPSSLPDQ